MAGKQSETIAERIRELAEMDGLEREIHTRLSFAEMMQLERLLNRVSPPREGVRA
jgi:hypothetical protein